jgi:hypothetical protein
MESFSRTKSFYEFSQAVKTGVYYFQVYASSGRSLYTITTQFRPDYTPPPVVQYIPEPEPVEPEPVISSRGGSTTTSKTPKGSKTPKSETPTTTEKPAQKPPAPSAGKTVTGKITLLTPRNDGSSEITIQGVGTDSGIEAGAIGVIVGLGVKIEATRCGAKSCKAVVPASAEPSRLKSGGSVTFTAK